MIDSAFLESLGITGDNASKIVEQYSKDTAEAKTAGAAGITQERDNLKSSLETMTKERDELSKLAGDVDNYKKKIEEFEAAEKKRKEEAEAAEADRLLTEKIMTYIGEKKFANDYVKAGVIADVKKAILADSTAGIEASLKSVLKDKTGIFESGNSVKIPSAGKTGGKPVSEDDEIVRKIMGLPSKKQS